jgi:uncharacterized Zn finger protein (UPF0148 family)
MKTMKIICPECGHPLSVHREVEDGDGQCDECQRLYPYNTPDEEKNIENFRKVCFLRPSEIEIPYLRERCKKLENKISKIKKILEDE